MIFRNQRQLKAVTINIVKRWQKSEIVQERINPQGNVKGNGWICVAIVFPWYSNHHIHIVSLKIHAALIFMDRFLFFFLYLSCSFNQVKLKGGQLFLLIGIHFEMAVGPCTPSIILYDCCICGLRRICLELSLLLSYLKMAFKYKKAGFTWI